MSGLNISEEERAVIRKQHEEATKKLNQKKADDKAGVQFKKPEKPVEEKAKEKN
jgi:hypothetical protein